MTDEQVRAFRELVETQATTLAAELLDSRAEIARLKAEVIELEAYKDLYKERIEKLDAEVGRLSVLDYEAAYLTHEAYVEKMTGVRHSLNEEGKANVRRVLAAAIRKGGEDE